MANVIEFKLCPEDRERLDKIIDLLAGAGTPYPPAGTYTVLPGQDHDGPAEIVIPEEEPQAEETALKPAPEEPKAAEPSVTLEEIQQKVVQLCAAGGDVKAKVRSIINEYGAKVSDLKDKPEKWDEVYSRLCALENEG